MQLDLAERRGVEQYMVDAFALTPFSGNPAGVMFEQREESWMQDVAMENNQAETSFLSAIPDTPANYSLRW